jgi:hypothetical protein
MAVVMTFISEAKGFEALSKLKERIRISQQAKLVLLPTQLVLAAPDDLLVCISVASRDVRFKFECFTIIPEEIQLPPWQEGLELSQVPVWQEIRCLFRFEWEAPATTDEVPKDWEQITRSRGKRSRISDSAVAIGVTLAGIAFWDTERNMPVTTISTGHDDDPAGLRVTNERNEMNELLNECEAIKLNEVSQWISHLKVWANEIRSPNAG